MDLEKLSKDLHKLKKISNTRKMSMFERLDVSRYENVSSKMLEFLLNSEEEHGIGNLATVALFEEANLSFEQPPRTLECISEVHATSDKFDHIGFIDLVVKLQDYTLVIENKISHILNNPFDLYREYAKTTFSKKNGHSGNNIFIVMGINKPETPPKNYIFISHEQFCQNLKKKISENISKEEKNKTFYFINDYIEAIENMTNTKVNQDKEEFFKFVTKSYQQLDQIQLQQQYIFDVAKNKLDKILENSKYKHTIFSENKPVKSNDSQWSGKGYYVYSKGIKKVFNGSEITLVISILASGAFLSVSMHDNRRAKKVYDREKLIESLKGYRLIPSEDKMEQLFDWEVIVEKWGYDDFNATKIAKTIDKYIEKLESIDFK